MNNWFTSTFKTVREKVNKKNSIEILFFCFQSIDALEFVRKDLTDFTTIVKTDTENYLNKLKNQSVRLIKDFCFFF